VWDADEFIAKAQAYFENADTESDGATDSIDSTDALWLLLGLEFLLRAPLARVHPTLLAAPEGTSILHAAGFDRPGANPRSIPTKTVVDRISHIEPTFNEDRKKDALFLADLRNGELHTSAAVLENVAPEAWLPQFLDTVTSLAEHLGIPLEDLLPSNVIEQASAARAKADRALTASVRKKITEAAAFFSGLTPVEIAGRLSTRPVPVPGVVFKNVTCPACAESSATVRCGPGRVGRSTYNEDEGTIAYTITYLAESLLCRVCNLSLSTTGEIVAAGVERLYVDEYEEDRYEGWENTLSHSDVIERLGIGEPDFEYGND
jgi:hypothetical protein